jgi:hypothetical protein
MDEAEHIRVLEIHINVSLNASHLLKVLHESLPRNNAIT